MSHYLPRVRRQFLARQFQLERQDGFAYHWVRFTLLVLRMKTRGKSLSGKNTDYYAHSLPDQPVSSWQTLESHLRNVAELAGGFAGFFEAADWARAAGILHDLGKYSLQFQAYLLHENGREDPAVTPNYRGHVPHAPFGAWKANELGPRTIGTILAYCIAGHHRGLPDYGDENVPGPCLWKYVNNCPEDLDVPFLPDDIATIEWPSRLPIRNVARDRVGFQVAFFIRMLFSCLVDADFLDTERFCSPGKSEHRGEYPSIKELLRIFDERIRTLVEGAEPTIVNQCRRNVLSQCISAARQKPGFFSLTVPTGGGKTLSSLAFALHHAAAHGLKRIIYAIPFTSIIEQNAKVFRDYLGNDSVVEHHYNIDMGDGRDDETSHPARLAAENWDAPIVATTNVQLFDSLLSNRSSKTRRLHNLAASVIVLDEAQTIPVEHLAPCLAALRELVSNYRATVVLCTATQPALKRRSDFAIGLDGVREIISDAGALFDRLQRVDVRVEPDVIPDDELAQQVAADAQALVIVNTRAHARKLFELIADAAPGDGSFHLSTLMCPAHRSHVLAEIRKRLNDGRACRVVSTQLIEAGVDVDFPRVYRAIAGLDSIAQAAGRCNREGKLDRGEVIVFYSEHAPPRGLQRQASQSAREVIQNHRDDLLCPAAIEDYFKMHYWTQSAHMDKLDILGQCNVGRKNAHFPFEKMAAFSLIEDMQRTVIVPYDTDAENLITQAREGRAGRYTFRRLQKYSVGVYQNVFDQLSRDRAIETVSEGLDVLADMRCYSETTGLDTEPSEPAAGIIV